MTSTGRPARSIAVTIDAHASTARSNDARSCAPGRTSSSTSTGARRRASFWRIIRCPRRAVDRQCTWRRSSPGAYSRSVWNSPLGSIARPHLRLLAVEVEAADLGRRRRCRGRAGTRSPASVPSTQRVRCTSPNGSVTVTRSGPISKRPRRSVGKRYAARASSPACERREQEARGAPAAVERVVDRERRRCGASPATTTSTRPCTPTCSRSFSSRAGDELRAR